MNKINLPENLDHLFDLGEALVRTHYDYGPESHLEVSKVAKINYTISLARDKYREVMRYKAMMNQAMSELTGLIGDDQESASNLKNTLQALVDEVNEDISKDPSSPIFKYILKQNLNQ